MGKGFLKRLAAVVLAFSLFPAQFGASPLRAWANDTASDDVISADEEAGASERAEPSAPEDEEERMRIPEKAVVTSHDAIIGGARIEYDATAGFIPLFDEGKKKERCRVFYVAYTRTDTAGGDDRPITFAFNGGPGSAAIWLHLGAFGPRTFQFEKDGLEPPRPPYRLEENPWSLLDVSDLVFIDPVGTGFSRADDEETQKEFWGVREDIASIADFIRMYITREGRWASPLFLAGESYGGLRAAGLSAHLQDLGIMPSGIILVSPAVSYGELDADSTNDRQYVHTVATMAATARYYGRSSLPKNGSPAEAAAEAGAWSRAPYLRALWDGNALPRIERERIEDEMAAYVGLSSPDVRTWNLRLPYYEFAGKILAAERRFVSLYDTRLSGPGGRYAYYEDPLFALVNAPYISAFHAYLRKDLRFETDLSYATLGDSPYAHWNWQSGFENGSYGYPNAVEDLAVALRRGTHLRLFVAMGLYDLVCPMDGVVYSINHMDVPAERLENVTFATYEGGHMMYTNRSALERLKGDLAAFYRKTLNR